MQKDDRADGLGEMTHASAVISENTPILESSDGVLGSGATSSMATPCSIAHDSVLAKRGRDELGDSAVATVGEYTAVIPAEPLDDGAAVVNWIVSIAGASGDCTDDAQVTPADQELRIARPPIVLGLGRSAVIARGDQGPI